MAMTDGAGQPPPLAFVSIDRAAIAAKVPPMMSALISLPRLPPGSTFPSEGFLLAITCNLKVAPCWLSSHSFRHTVNPVARWDSGAEERTMRSQATGECGLE